MSDLRLPLGKVCMKCQEWKLYEDYYRAKNFRDGKRSWCKACENRLGREAYKADPEKPKARTRERYHNDPEYRTRLLELSRQYKERDKERFADRRRAWRQAHSESRKVNEQKRRIKKLGNGGEFTLEEWTALCELHGNKCLRCGSTGPLTVDHVVPVSKGGVNSIENLQPLCLSCNSSKGAQTIDYR